MWTKKLFILFACCILLPITACNKENEEEVEKELQMPQWLLKKIEQMKQDEKTAFTYNIYDFRWRGNTYFYINSLFSSCMYCDFYDISGKKIKGMIPDGNGSLWNILENKKRIVWSGLYEVNMPTWLTKKIEEIKKNRNEAWAYEVYDFPMNNQRYFFVIPYSKSSRSHEIYDKDGQLFSIEKLNTEELKTFLDNSNRGSRLLWTGKKDNELPTWLIQKINEIIKIEDCTTSQKQILEIQIDGRSHYYIDDPYSSTRAFIIYDEKGKETTFRSTDFPDKIKRLCWGYPNRILG